MTLSLNLTGVSFQTGKFSATESDDSYICRPSRGGGKDNNV